MVPALQHKGRHASQNGHHAIFYYILMLARFGLEARQIQARPHCYNPNSSEVHVSRLDVAQCQHGHNVHDMLWIPLHVQVVPR